jgi:hypothetical protein
MIPETIVDEIVEMAIRHDQSAKENANAVEWNIPERILLWRKNRLSAHA